MQAGSLHRFDRAQQHVVVVRPHRANIFQPTGLFNERLHHRPTTLGGEVTASGLNDPHAGKLGDDRRETLLPLDRRGRPDGTLQLNDVAAPAACLSQPGSGQSALEIGVGCNARDEQRRIGVDRPVGDEYGNMCGLCLPQHRRPSGDDNRGDDDRIDPLVDEAANRGELPLDAMLRVVKPQIDATKLGLGFHVRRKRGAPVTLGPNCENPTVSADAAAPRVRNAAAMKLMRRVIAGQVIPMLAAVIGIGRSALAKQAIRGRLTHRRGDARSGRKSRPVPTGQN